MNHLAHFFLAERSSEAVAGALLGDFVKGRISTTEFPPAMRDEIVIHRQIDAFTDRDDVLLNCKNRFVKTRRRLTGIALDVASDHFLAKNWELYTSENLDDFANFAYRSLETHIGRFPPLFQNFLPRMIDDDFLSAYRDLSRVEFALDKLSKRLRDGENLRTAFGEIKVNYEYFDECFCEFFPRLQQFVIETRSNL